MVSSSPPPATDSPAPPTTPPHHSYVPADARMREFTWPAVLLGALLGIVFGASSMYLVLKVGMTISASIPVAVLSITLFRGISRVFGFRRATILENNIVQTTGSAGESIAFGVGVTMPALMLLGFEMEVGRVLLVSVLGGALGILMMIPLRRAFIVQRHEELKYPEGTACAEVLIVGEQGGTSARTVFVGFGLAAAYMFLMQGVRLWKETVSHALSWYKGAEPSIEVSPALLGVGYIIGTRISCIMLAGGVLAYLVFVPAIHFFGDRLPAPLYPGVQPIAEMGADAIRDKYVLYIGAGAVAAGGIISLFQALPLILGSIRAGLRDLRATPAAGQEPRAAAPRTDRDISLRWVALGALALVTLIWVTLPLTPPYSARSLTLGLLVNMVAAVLIVGFGFLFVTVSSRLTGEIGSSSNPISGMTVATLLLTCLIFLVLGWTDPQHRLLALSVAAIVCIASSNGGTTSQDLKTGYLVGATPVYQQWAILIGSVSSALVIGWVLIVLDQAGTVYTARDLPALKAPLNVDELTDRQRAPGDAADYRVWRPRDDNPQGVPPGKYLVDDQGKLHYRVDPGINGSLHQTDDGGEVTKFTAPKAQLMALITDGILRQKLPWDLVLLGVFTALVLELCGVPSLPFAVGVYLPLSASTPIFVGGVLRAVIDRWGPRAGGDATAADADTSPGALLSTGYIAGGSIGGVVMAALSLNADFSKTLAQIGAKLHITSDWAALVAFGLLAAYLAWLGLRRRAVR